MLITSENIEDVLHYIQGEKPTLYISSKVKYKHPKKTKGKEVETTFGRILFNLMLPVDYPFINEPVNRGKLKKILVDINDKYDDEVYKETVLKIQKYSMLLSSIVPATVEISKLHLPDELEKERQELLKKADELNPVEFDKELDKLYEKFQEYLTKENVTFFDMVKSGTKGKKSDLQQLFLAWGPAIQPLSEETPIVKHSLLDGMTPEEMYYGSNKSRYAAYLKSVGAAMPGYLSRKMRWALADVRLSKSTEDCKTTKYFELKIDDRIVDNIIGRYYYDEKDGKLKVIDNNNVEKLKGKTIKMRSPLYCKAKDGICKTCIGKLAEQIGVEELGTNTSQVLYNITLNTLMKISHGKITAQDEVDFISDIKKFF